MPGTSQLTFFGAHPPPLVDVPSHCGMSQSLAQQTSALLARLRASSLRVEATLSEALPPDSAALRYYLCRTYGAQATRSGVARNWTWHGVELVWTDFLPPSALNRLAPYFETGALRRSDGRWPSPAKAYFVHQLVPPRRCSRAWPRCIEDRLPDQQEGTCSIGDWHPDKTVVRGPGNVRWQGNGTGTVLTAERPHVF